MNSRLSAVVKSACHELPQMTADQHTLSAAANKLRTLTNEVLGDIGKLLESLRHDGRNEEL